MSQTALRLVDGNSMDKQKALDAALGQIERAFGKGSIMKLGSRPAASAFAHNGRPTPHTPLISTRTSDCSDATSPRPPGPAC